MLLLFFTCFRDKSLLFLSLLIGLAYLRNEQIRPRPQQISNEKVRAMVFIVDDFPVKKSATWSVQARSLGFNDGIRWFQGSGKYIIYMSKEFPKPQRGEMYVARLQLKGFAKPMFPAERNWEDYYLQKGVYGTAFIAKKQWRLLLNNSVALDLVGKFHAWQDAWAQLFNRYMPVGRNLEVAKAMLLGIHSSIDFETMSAYSYLGAIHILSVSGLHVGLLYMGLHFFLRFLKSHGFAGRFVFFSLMLFLLWIYAGISGFSAPVLRSAWMFSVMLFASSFGRRHNSINTLAFSAFLMLLIDPGAMVQPGFQLSYLAVLGLMLFQTKLANWKTFKISNPILFWIVKNAWELTCVAISAQVLTWPLIIYYFHQFPNPFYFFLLNPFLILLSTISLGLGFLFLAFGPLFEYFSWTFLNQVLGRMLDHSFSALHGLMLTTVGRFQTVIPFLHCHVWELGLYVLLIVFAWRWLVDRSSIFAWLMVISLLVEGVFRFSKDTKLESAWLGHYKGELIWVSIKNNRSIFWAPSSLQSNPTWLQNHLSPMWAMFGVTDTIGHYYPKGQNLVWRYKNQHFRYVSYPCLKPKEQPVHHVIFSKGLKLHTAWLASWTSSNPIFLQNPSRYFREKYGLRFTYLSEMPALRY